MDPRPFRSTLFATAGLLAAIAGRAAEPGPAPTLPAIADPPGAVPFVEGLRRELAEAVAAFGPGYEPRTRHRREGGGAIYTNRLVLEASPYLQQHAHNPVNWFPWGGEAFETARRLGRPVLLSIGYSTCHWCHVMEEESFEDEEIAEFLNRHYVAVKVDREERPDLDAIYMRAVQSIVGRGGWPLTVWLTPDRQPFYGGSYFPARDGDRGARAGFLTLLRRLEEVWSSRPEQVARHAAEITRVLRQPSVGRDGGEVDVAATLERAVGTFASTFDPVDGGLRGAPKFPSSFPLRLMLRESERTGEPAAAAMALLTLRRIGEGGIHDRIGGGFHRYSTDARWIVPHFEKMLYDNARLAAAYVEAYQASGDARYARTARSTLDYLLREMRAPSGGFYSATDADSAGPQGEREEGRYFTWTPAEIEAVLGEELGSLVIRRYGITVAGNFEGRSVPHVASPLEPLAADGDVDRLRERLEQARTRLYEARAERAAPSRDEKILTAWNALTISALARAGFALEHEPYLAAAKDAARFLLESMYRDGRLYRSYAAGRARMTAYLDDHTLTIAALIDLYEASAELAWLRSALELQRRLDLLFWDEESGGYFMTADDHETLLVRHKPDYDGAIPSGNSVALSNLVRLHALTLDDRYRMRGSELRGAFAEKLSRYPGSLAEMLLALQYELADPVEVFIVAPRSRAQADPFLDVLRGSYLPFRVLAVAVEGTDLNEQRRVLPPFEGKVARDGRATAYVCRRGLCRRPAVEVDEFIVRLRNVPVEQDPARP